MEENATATTGAENTGAATTTTESVATDDFDDRSPAQIESARREAEASAKNTDTQDDDDTETGDDSDDTSETDDATATDTQTQTQTQSTETKTEAPSQTTETQVKEATQQIDINLPVDEAGQIDVNKLPTFVDDVMKAAAAKAESIINNAKYFENEENSVKQAYPQIAKDPDLFKMVKDLRTADALAGGKGDLMEQAKTIAGRLNLAKEEGKQSQKQHVTRQKSARLETSKRTVATGEQAKLRQLTTAAFSSPDRATRESARIERIKLLRTNGQL